MPKSSADSPSWRPRSSAPTAPGSRPKQVAEGFIDIAVGAMANAVKKISVARGYDVTRYTLQCYGGAGGQHACRVADALGIDTVFVHPLAGVLSAYGMGLADQSVIVEASVEQPTRPARPPVVRAARRAARRRRARARTPRGGWRPVRLAARAPSLRGHRLRTRRSVRDRRRDPRHVRSRLPHGSRS